MHVYLSVNVCVFVCMLALSCLDCSRLMHTRVLLLLLLLQCINFKRQNFNSNILRCFHTLSLQLNIYTLYVSKCVYLCVCVCLSILLLLLFRKLRCKNKEREKKHWELTPLCEAEKRKLHLVTHSHWVSNFFFLSFALLSLNYPLLLLDF